MDLINMRRSVRKFTNEEITDDKLMLLVKAAMQAPTAVNQQANVFFVVKKKENIEKLHKAIPGSLALATANKAIIVLIDKTKLKRNEFKEQDAANSAMLILLEATSLGIGSCWCAIYPYQERMIEVAKILNLPNNLIPFCAIALGYPENKNPFYFINRFDETRVLSD